MLENLSLYRQPEFLTSVFVIGSVVMTVTITDEKNQRIKNIPIRSVAIFLASLIIAVPVGKMHYRCIENDKSQSLKGNGGSLMGLWCSLYLRWFGE